jgi:hypothetical protein
MVCECVSETSISRIPTRSAQRSVLPDSVTPGFGGPTISISFHVKRTPQPRAFPTASFPQNRAAYDSAGLRRDSQYACSSGVKHRSRKPGRSSARRIRSISIRSVPIRMLTASRATPAGRRSS